jgi:MYXO-CTERM domain-containing protein
MVILEQVNEEICDGLDNDCDDMIDEELDPIPCGNAACPGMSVCTGVGGWSECDARDPVAENCSTEIDDDCDGTANEGCGCNPATDPGLPCGTETGECKPGVLRCLPNGQYDDVCEGEIGPSDEICDGKDNDCDGQIDEATLQPGDDYPQNPCSGGGAVTPPAGDNGNAAGCACEVGGGRSSSGAIVGLMLMFGLALVVRRKRK